MRLFGHPVHVMLVHFPIAFWPAHLLLHVLAGSLPPGVGPIAGFWLLVVGTALGWVAACAGALDLLPLANGQAPRRLRAGLVHAGLNGGALLGFTGLAALEYASYPHIHHVAAVLSAEALVLVGMFAGNYFGAEARGMVGSGDSA